MLDKATTLKEVQKYLAKGAIDKAISELEQLVNESPEGNVFNMIGDLYLKKGIQKSSIEYYQKAANYFRQEGFSQKAQALYKKVLNLSPNNADALYAFGELNEEKGLTTDAIKYYLATADLLSKEGRKEKILGIYEKILSLSPANIPLRTKVAEIFIKEGLKSDAAREYLHIARIHEETGDQAKSKEIFLKALDLHPRSKDAALGLSSLYEKLGEIKEAAAQLKNAALHFPDDQDVLFRSAEISLKHNDRANAKQCLAHLIEKEPENVKARRMLGDLYLEVGSAEKAWEQYLPVLDTILTDRKYEDAINLLETFKQIDPVETGKRLISLFRQLGEQNRVCDELVSLGDYYALHNREEDAHSCYTETLEIDPEHKLARLRIAPSPSESEPIPDTNQAGPAEIPLPDVDLSPEDAADFSVQAAPEETATGPNGIQETGNEEDSEHILAHGEKTCEEIITEVDIFSRYGLSHEAQKLLEGLKGRFPENIDVHLRLKALYTDIHEKELAITECIILSGLYKRQDDEIRSGQMIKEAYEINPEDPRLAELGFSRPMEPASFIAPSEEDFTKAIPDKEPDIEDYEEELAEAEFYSRQGLTAEAVTILEKLQKLFPENRDIMERLHALGQTASFSDTQEISSELEFSDTFDALDPSARADELKTPEPAGSSGDIAMTGETERKGSSALPGSEGIFQELEEEEQIPHEVREVPNEATESLQETTREEPSLTEGLQREVSDEVSESAYENFSFTDNDLVEAEEMPEPLLDNEVLEIFQEFKKGLEKELGDEDSETHYNLGIAYKEMGLIDDAIKEFQTSKNDAKRFLQSSTMLGVCYMEKGLCSLAVDILEKALKTLKDKDDSYWALSYELAEAYEKNDDLHKAFALYTEIYGWDAKFRNVSDKMGQLRPKMPQAAETETAKDKEKPRERKDRVSYL